jgi:hypothetical protein
VTVIRLVCREVSSEVKNDYICRNRPCDVSVSMFFFFGRTGELNEHLSIPADDCKETLITV